MSFGASEVGVLAWARMMRASQAVLDAIETDLQAAGFPPLSWYDVLLELRRAGGALRPVALQQRLLIAQPNLSRLIDRLGSAGLVERRPHPGDGRGQDIHITEDGRALLARMWPAYRESIDRHLGQKLTPEEASSLAALLAKLVPPA